MSQTSEITVKNSEKEEASTHRRVRRCECEIIRQPTLWLKGTEMRPEKNSRRFQDDK